MTLQEAISKFDLLHRNTIPNELKVDWISQLDSIIYNEIILTHEGSENIKFSPYTSKTPADTPLLVPEPYSEVYVKYLASQKDLYLSDIARYNNNIMLYSAAYRDFENHYNSKHLPLKKVSFFNA